MKRVVDKIRLTSLRCHSIDTIRRHCLVSNDGMRFCLPKCDAFLPVPLPGGSFSRRLEEASTQPCSVPFLGFDMSPWIFSSVSFHQRSRGVKHTVCRPSRHSFLPAMSPAFKIDFKLNEHPR